MFNHNNPSITSITSEELRWLDADAQILQDSSFFDAQPSPTSTYSHFPLSSDSLPIPRTKSPPRHHYQRSTKSSSAKVVTPAHHSNRISSSLAPKRPNHPNLRSVASTPTPFFTPSLSNFSLPSLSGRSDITSSTESISAPRLTKRSHSPTTTPPRSPEWIYRRPKSPTTPPTFIRRRPEMNRSASEPSATSQGCSINYFSEISSSSSSLPSPKLSCSEATESSTLWTSLLRPRKRSGSVASKSTVNTSDIPSLWFGADDGASRSSPSSSSRFLKNVKVSSSPLLTSSPGSLSRSPSQSSISASISKHDIRVQRNRSSSVSSSISSISTSTTSSLPQTPSSPSFSPSIMKKFKPNHQCIIEDVEPESEPEDKLTAIEQSISTRRKDSSSDDPMPSTPVFSQSFTSPKRRLKLDTSSNKSVKFVDTPTVHYASAGYEPDFWHIPGESMDTDDAIDTDQMDMENEAVNATETSRNHDLQVPSISHPYAYAQSPYRMDVDEDTSPSKVSSLRNYRPEDREMLCVTPTPDRVRERGGRGLKRGMSSKSIKRQPSSGSSWRSVPSSSPSRSITPRPAISRPFVLGSASVVPSHSSESFASTRAQSRSKLVSSGIALRSAPSLESFRSVKSNTRSVRSLRSLKSLPESVKSSIEVGAREMKEWFKGRISIGVGAL